MQQKMNSTFCYYNCTYSFLFSRLLLFEIVTLRPNMCNSSTKHSMNDRLTYQTKFRWTKFSSDKIFRLTKFSTPSRNFDSFVRFLPDSCIEILDKIFEGQNFSSNKMFRLTKFPTPSRNFDNFVRRIFVP